MLLCFGSVDVRNQMTKAGVRWYLWAGPWFIIFYQDNLQGMTLLWQNHFKDLSEAKVGKMLC